ncbi:MAG: hypothetical protein AAGC68_03370, partial [Verrucomicrobiota bacterium]
QEITVERIDGFVTEYNPGLGIYEQKKRSTVGILDQNGFRPFYSPVGDWVGDTVDPSVYRPGTYWAFACWEDMGTLEQAYPWADFRWGPNQRTENTCGNMQVIPSGGSASRANISFGHGRASWRTIGLNRVRIRVPQIINIGGLRSGTIRFYLIGGRGASVSRGGGKVMASASYSPLPGGYQYKPHTRTVRMRRPGRGRFRSALHVAEYTGPRYTIRDTRTFGTTRFR